MKYTTKNKILVIVYALIAAFLVFVQIKRQEELWEKLTLVLLAIVTVLLYMQNVNRIKYFSLIDDVLVIRQTFSKQKQFSLKTVSNWTENQYQLLGFKTGREIVLKTKEGVKINLFEKNSKDFEKLSDYLNENISEGFEN